MIPRKRLLNRPILPSNHEQSNKRAKSSGSVTTHIVDPVSEALVRLKALFPVNDFLNQLPPILWKQQVYACCSDLSRTEIDRKLNDLSHDGIIRFVKLGSTVTQSDVAIVYSNDLRTVCLSKGPNDVAQRFLDSLDVLKDPVISKDDLSAFTDQEIQQLVTNGLLAVNRTVGSWLLSIPGAGTFVKSFSLGRKVLLRTIRSTKFNEISIRDLEKRKLPKQVRLSCEYLVLEMIGSDCVTRVETPTGPIVRINT